MVTTRVRSTMLVHMHTSGSCEAHAAWRKYVGECVNLASILIVPRNEVCSSLVPITLVGCAALPPLTFTCTCRRKVLSRRHAPAVVLMQALEINVKVTASCCSLHPLSLHNFDSLHPALVELWHAGKPNKPCPACCAEGQQAILLDH